MERVRAHDLVGFDEGVPCAYAMRSGLKNILTARADSECVFPQIAHIIREEHQDRHHGRASVPST